MIVGATGSYDSGGVVEASEANEGMTGALGQQRLIDQGTNPGQNEREKALEQDMYAWWEVGELGSWVGGREW